MAFIKNPTHSVIGDSMANKPVNMRTAPSVTSINKTGIANKFANTIDGVMMLKYLAVIGNIPIHTARETDKLFKMILFALYIFDSLCFRFGTERKLSDSGVT